MISLISTGSKSYYLLLDLVITNESLFCLFVWCFTSLSRIFHSYEDVTSTCEGLQILTCAWHSWPLSSEGSLASTPSVTWSIRLKWSSPRTHVMHACCRAFGSGAVTTCFYDWDLNIQPFAWEANALTDCAKKRVFKHDLFV